LDARKLRSFVVLAEELHFSRAAVRLQISQSTLSARVRELERQLGARLFDRSTRRVELTDAGRRLLEEARTAVAMLDDAAQVARAPRGPSTRTRIGSSPAARDGVIEPILDRYEASSAGPPLSLREGASSALLRDLAESRIDVAITFCDAGPEAGHSERLVETRARVSLRAEDAPGPGPVRLAELAHVPIVLLRDPDSQGYNRLVQRACADAGLAPEIAWIPRGGSSEAFRRSGGYTFVVPWAEGFSDRGMVALEVVGPAPVLHLDLAWRDDDAPGVGELLHVARTIRRERAWMP